MMITITRPDVLKRYPHLSPGGLRLTDMEATAGGQSVSTYTETKKDANAGHGRLSCCSLCGTYLRAGQPHSTLQPEPHQALDMLTVYEPEDFEERLEERAEERLEEKRLARRRAGSRW